MRSREEIENQRGQVGWHGDEEKFELTLEVLLDIRQLLLAGEERIQRLEQIAKERTGAQPGKWFADPE